MRTNPLADIGAFLTAPSYSEPAFMPVLYGLVALTSLAVAIAAARRVPSQRTASHLGRFIVRFIVGSMWWQQALWKFPTDLGGLRYWTDQIVSHAAFAVHAAFTRDVIVPIFATPAGAVIFFVEIAIAAALMIGLFTKLAAFGGALFIANLWLGLYRLDSEWPWSYVFIILLHAVFVFDAYGRSLGLDALLRADQSFHRRLPRLALRFT